MLASGTSGSNEHQPLKLSIFVGGLALETTKASLRTHFGECGKIIAAHIVADPQTGAPRGFGKVKFSTNEAAAKAISEKNGSLLDGCQILVRSFDPNVDEAPAPARRGWPVFVAGLSGDTTQEDLHGHFRQCGMVIKAFVGAKGLGRVDMGTEAAAADAITQLNGSTLHRRSIVVKDYAPPAQGSQPKDHADATVYAQRDGEHVVFVSGLPPTATVQKLRQHFSACGEIRNAIIFSDKHGPTTRSGRVDFAKLGGKRVALNKMFQSEFDGCTVMVSEFYRGQTPAKASDACMYAVFVGGLPADIEVERLKANFEQVGEVISCTLLGTGKSKGSARVAFKTQEAQRRAIERLNKSMLDGNHLLVRAYSAAPAPKVPVYPVFVSNLPFSTQPEALQSFFRVCGETKDCRLLPDAHGNFKGTAVVEFVCEDSREKAISDLNGQEFEGRSIVVRYFRAAPAVSFSILVSGISTYTSTASLKTHFSSCGKITGCRTLMSSQTGQSFLRAKIDFATKVAKDNAISRWQGTSLDGCLLSVQEFVDKPANRATFPVFCAGLSWDTTEEAIITFFEHVGEVASCFRLKDAQTGRLKGAARIYYTSEEAQQRAIKELHMSEFDSRIIMVRPVLNDTERQDSFGVFVMGLAVDTSAKALLGHCQKVGDVVNCRILLDDATRRSRGLARVDFASEAAQLRAVEELHQTSLDGMLITVIKHRSSPDADVQKATQGADKSVFVAGLSLGTTSQTLRDYSHSAGRSPSDCSTAVSSTLPAADARESLRKLNPDDGKLYTLEELRTLFGQNSTLSEVTDFWQFDCISLEDEAAAVRALTNLNDRRVYPEDDNMYSFKEFHSKAQSEGFTENEIIEYWIEECLPAPGSLGDASVSAATPATTNGRCTRDEPEECRLDPEDGQICTFQELETKLKSQFTREEIEEYWELDCEPVAETNSA